MHKLLTTCRSHLKILLPNLRFVVAFARSRHYTQTPNANSDVVEELKSSKPIDPSPEFVLGMEHNFHQTEPSQSSDPSAAAAAAAAQISHPWPEWVDLMALLSKEGYFDAEGNPFQNVELGPRESNRIRTACLNFARDRYDVMRGTDLCDFLRSRYLWVGRASSEQSFFISFALIVVKVSEDIALLEKQEISSIVNRKSLDSYSEGLHKTFPDRYLSKKHIQVIAECGCPSTDRKVVNSGKRLRSHVGIDEGNVCSSCNLRGNCERAFVKAREDEGGRTVDVMRILLTYGLDPISSTVENKPCLTRTVKESVRTLLKQMAENGTDVLGSDLLKPTPAGDPSWHSNSEEKGHIDVPTKPGDWHCPKCNFLNFAKNIKCLRCDTFSQERLNQLQEDQDHLPLKKGDWICDKCNFLNFAKNTRCLQCKEKPPKRQLNPGEWECESCNYINFRRNMVCLKCDYRRPKASHSSGSSQQEHDVGSHHRGHEAGEDRNSMWRRNSQTRVANRWRFVIEENGVSEKPMLTNSANDISGILDFPIAGGVSDLSRDTEKRETWKLKMLERSRMTTEEKANPAEPRSCRVYRKSESPDFEDDKEMAEWFGSGKM